MEVSADKVITNALYLELKKQIEDAKAEGNTGIMIANSETLSADQIHRWFTDMEVGWKNDRIYIRW